jgi:hypothetical protein
VVISRPLQSSPPLIHRLLGGPTSGIVRLMTTGPGCLPRGGDCRRSRVLVPA